MVALDFRLGRRARKPTHTLLCNIHVSSQQKPVCV